MFAISDNDRRAGSRPGKVSRDVPVLFHLLDVSPRPPQSPPLPPSAVEAEAEDKNGPPAPPGCSSYSDERPTSESLATSAPPATSDPSAASFLPPLRKPEMPLAAVTGSPAPPAIIDVPAAEAAHAEVAQTAKQPALAERMPLTPSGPDVTEDTATLSTPPTAHNAAGVGPPPTETERPTPRQRARPPASEDWLASHGKFIALGFLLALGGTIYLARTRRPHDATEVTQVTSPAPLIDEPPAIAVPSAAPTTASRPPPMSSPIADKSPANLVETASATSESKVELHPPAAPPLLAPAVANASDSRATNPGAKDSLFDFPAANKADDRLASRSDVAAPSSLGSPPTGPVAEVTTAAQASAPELAPAYPTTNAPMPAYPVTTSAPVAYPTTQSPAPPVAQPVAVTSSYGPMPQAAMPQAAMPQAAMPQSGMPPIAPPAAANYRSAYAPSGPVASAPPGAAQNPAAPSPTTWTPAAPGSQMPPQYPSSTNTATGPRYERTGSGHY